MSGDIQDPNVDPDVDPPAATDMALAPSAPAGAPYGLIGTCLSTLAILAVAALAAGLVAGAAFGIAAAFFGAPGAAARFAALDPSNGHDAGFAVRLNIVVGVSIYALVSLTILAAARLRGGARWRDLVAWRPWSPFRGARLFWLLFALTLVYSIGADKVVTAIHPQAQDWTPKPTGLVWDMLFFGLAAVFAPVTEELMFRGWVYTGLRGAIGVPMTILVSSAAFALAHWESTHLYALAIFPVGLALGVVREKTGSIAASIAFHALYNGVATVVLLAQ